MITLTINKGQIDRLKQALEGTSRKLEREIKTAVNATSKKVALEAARDLSKEMPLKIGTLKKIVRQKAKATNERPRAVIGIGRGYPVPLKYFKAKQIKRGVTYKLSKKAKSKSVLRDAFVVRRFGNNVYKRAGTSRGPLVQQYGPAPGEYFEGLRIIERSLERARAELEKQMDRRIRFVLLEKTGQLRGKRK